jgi:hypothetical protein
MTDSRFEIGVVSDTHGLLRPEALAALRGVSLILHAGDVGSGAVLEGLRAIAPVVAVRGNNDAGPWAKSLAASEVVEIGRALVYVIHDLGELDLEPRAAGFHAVVSGHSHRPKLETRDGVCYLNPGSIGPRRFRLPVALARLTVSGTAIDARLLELDV